MVLAPLTLGVRPGSAAPPREHHCVHPDGVDLNELHATPYRIVTHFCPLAVLGERWIPAAAWVTNSSHEVLPPGYVPSAGAPIEDFNAKFVAARYVIDAGTRQERTYSFGPSVLQTGLIHPTFELPMTAFLPVLPPSPPGPHTVDIYVTLNADHWDGLGTDPAWDLIPAGETHWDHVPFDVVRR